jgi:hypothetical protein
MSFVFEKSHNRTFLMAVPKSRNASIVAEPADGVPMRLEVKVDLSDGTWIVSGTETISDSLDAFDKVRVRASSEDGFGQIEKVFVNQNGTWRSIRDVRREHEDPGRQTSGLLSVQIRDIEYPQISVVLRNDSPQPVSTWGPGSFGHLMAFYFEFFDTSRSKVYRVTRNPAISRPASAVRVMGSGESVEYSFELSSSWEGTNLVPLNEIDRLRVVFSTAVDSEIGRSLLIGQIMVFDEVDLQVDQKENK